MNYIFYRMLQWQWFEGIPGNFLSPSPKNWKKIKNKKKIKFLYFRKWNFLTLTLKNVLTFSAQVRKIKKKILRENFEKFLTLSQKKPVLILWETKIPKMFFIFQEKELSNASGNKSFKKLLMFQGEIFRAGKIKKVSQILGN